MKIKSGFVVRTVGGNSVVVATGANSKTFHGMIRLNECGRLLWERLKEDVTVDCLVSAVLEEYEIDEETARADVQSFLNTIREAGVLDE